MSIGWPWTRKGSRNQLVVSWFGQTLSYVIARLQANGSYEVIKFGVVRQGADSIEDFVRRLRALRLKGYETRIMLLPDQYQLMQIDAPAVAPDEMRAAARYQIRAMVDVQVDDLTIDVMRVGDGRQKGAGQLYVVAATNAVVRDVLDLGEVMNWTVSVIDIQETAQRNLQNALAARDGQADGANAALVLVDGQKALLTISANEELFYTRRFELPEGFLTAPWRYESDVPAGLAESIATFTPVDEYVPDYSMDGVSYGTDYTEAQPVLRKPVSDGDGNDEKAQLFVLEVQRSLDVWSRSWSNMPLSALRVYAGERSTELSKWLGAQLGQTLMPMDVTTLFSGFESEDEDSKSMCSPLLGVLMRTDSRKL